MVKNPPTIAGDTGVVSSVLGSGRSPGKGNGNALQFSYLGNPMDRGAWTGGLQSMGLQKVRHELVTKQQQQVNLSEMPIY